MAAKMPVQPWGMNGVKDASHPSRSPMVHRPATTKAPMITTLPMVTTFPALPVSEAPR